jgi:hypothetical protein
MMETLSGLQHHNDVGAYDQVLSFASTSVHTSNCRRNTCPTGLPSPSSLYYFVNLNPYGWDLLRRAEEDHVKTVVPTLAATATSSAVPSP